MDVLTGLLGVGEVLYQMFLAHVVLPFLAVFGEGILGFVHVLVELPFILIIDVSNKDCPEGTEGLCGFHISCNA